MNTRRIAVNACILMSDEELEQLGRVASGVGCLETAHGKLPLTALHVMARIVALSAEVELVQIFHNTLSEPLEATYIFPLPDRAAVTSFRMEVGGRVIDGVIDERGRARADYEQAIAAGERAAIAEEDRAGVFTLRVGNLMPDEKAVIRLTLVGPVPFEEGEANFSFPLVVAPRYIPGIGLPGPQAGTGIAADTDAVADASRITPPLLLPGFPNPIQLTIAVTLEGGGLPVSGLRSSLHVINTVASNGAYTLTVQPGERLNRDFILRWRMGDSQVRSTAVMMPDAEGGAATCLITVIPPAEDGTASRPRDVVFVVDRSGSMQGWKMVAARRAVARMVDTLAAQDRFAVLAFDNDIETPGMLSQIALVQASDRQRFRAVEFLAKVEARGGTELLAPLQAATQLLQGDDASRDRVLVLVTDGQVGNEDQILRELAPQAKQLRVFTLGIDRAVNAAFLRRLAALGGGACELVESEERLDEVMSKVHRRIAQPVVTRLQVHGEGVGLQTASLAPARLPDLFTATPVLIAARLITAASGTIVIRGQSPSGRGWSQTVPLLMQNGSAAASIWARARIRDLEDRYVTESHNQTALEQEIVALSLRHRVLSRFTAFLAVDRSAAVNPGGNPLLLIQPVEKPEGWSTVLYARCVRSASPGAAAREVMRACMPPPMAAAAPVAAGVPQGQMKKKAMQRVLSMLSGKSSGDEQPLDLTPYLQRARELADALEQLAAGNDLDLLDRSAARLFELIEDLRSVYPDCVLLEELSRAAQGLRAVLDGAGEDLAAGCRRVAAQLRQAVQPLPDTPDGSRQAFWK
jgi:Ca-activated chloride channel homolog